MKKRLDEFQEFKNLVLDFDKVLNSVTPTERLQMYYETSHHDIKVRIREGYSCISHKWSNIITYMKMENKDYEVDSLKALVRTNYEPFIIADRYKMVFNATNTVLYHNDLKDDFGFFNHSVLLSPVDYENLQYASLLQIPPEYNISIINLEAFDNIIYRKLMEMPDE